MFTVVLQAAITSIEALLANKVRSFITMLGIIIGVSSVVLIMSIGAGAQSLILSQVQSLGSGLINISPGQSDSSNPLDGFTTIAATTLTYDDVLALRDSRELPHVAGVVGFNKGFNKVSFESESYDTSLSGTTASYIDVEGGEVASGRFFSKDEEKSTDRIVVLGSAVVDALFPSMNPVGERVKIDKQRFRVIGVMKERGTVGLTDYDDQVFIPLKTSQQMLGVNHVGSIRARVSSDAYLESSMESIRSILRDEHDIDDLSGDEDDFTVGSSAETLGIVTMITDGLRLFLTAMAALSLVVGGIGIMNIMFISVYQRTREIGLRKAIGANNTDILVQFILESIMITGVGGVIGIVIGAFLSLFVAIGVHLAGFDWSFIISPSSVVLALTVSSAVGLLFGLYPAWKASRLEPIAALRHE